MKRSVLLLFILASMTCTDGRREYADYPIHDVNIRNITLNDHFWLPKIKMIQDRTIQHAFEKCNQEGRIDNFLVAGGVKSGSYKGKMPFDDTDLYKIIEGASYSLISNPDPGLAAYLDSIIAVIKTGQEPDGYLTTWFTIDRHKPPAWWVEPSEHRWEHLESSHELYNSGHLFEAAAAHYRATGMRNFLDIALKNADLLINSFGPGPDKLHKPPGHQIAETGLIKLYQITGNAQYLELAKYFLDLRGDSTTHQLYGDYSQDHLPVIRQTEAVGHAVRALYMYAGMTDIAVICQDPAYLSAVNRIWENLVTRKMYITGGLGSQRGGEAFGADYELPNLSAYNETCAAIGDVYWNHRLFLLTGDAKYFDIIERTLYNGLLSGISLDGQAFFYPNPTEADGEYAFNMGSCTRQPWFDCSCCPTNLIRFIPSVPGLIYATDQDSIYVNLYMTNRSEIEIKGEKIEISQDTDFPYGGRIVIAVNPERASEFTMKLRIPGWAQNHPLPGDLYNYQYDRDAGISLSVNGQNTELDLGKGYAVISRNWTPEDSIELVLPMMIRQVVANEHVSEDSNKVAFEYGPVVYCAEETDNPQIQEIMIDDHPELSIKSGSVLSEKVLEITGKCRGASMTLIPYYTWSNRGVGKMKVWFPVTNSEQGGDRSKE